MKVRPMTHKLNKKHRIRILFRKIISSDDFKDAFCKYFAESLAVKFGKSKLLAQEFAEDFVDYVKQAENHDH